MDKIPSSEITDRRVYLRRRELVWAAPRDQRVETGEELASDIGLALQERFD